VSLLNFLDPKFNEDGTPYGVARFKNIVQERYFISKKCNTSYLDVGYMTPLERKYVLGFILEEIEKEKEELEKEKAKQKNNSNKFR